MFENIQLLNCLKRNGEPIDKRITTSMFLLRSILVIALIIIASLYLILYGFMCVSMVGSFRITIDLFFQTLISSSGLKVLLVGFCVFLYILWYLKSNEKRVIFKIKSLNGEEVLWVLFTDKKYLNMEYQIPLKDIHDIKIYSNNIVTFYCDGLMIKEKCSNKKYILLISGNDAFAFVSDLSNVYNKPITYLKKKK